MDPVQRDKKMELIKNQCKLLAQSFDAVQIFATRYEPENDGDTAHYVYGEGNWYARAGLIQEWVKRNEKSCQEDE